MRIIRITLTHTDNREASQKPSTHDSTSPNAVADVVQRGRRGTIPPDDRRRVLQQFPADLDQHPTTSRWYTLKRLATR